MMKKIYDLTIFFVALGCLVVTVIYPVKWMVFLAIILFVVEFNANCVRDDTFGEFVFSDLLGNDDEDIDNIIWMPILKKLKVIMLGWVPIIYIVVGVLYGRMYFDWKELHLELVPFLTVAAIFFVSWLWFCNQKTKKATTNKRKRIGQMGIILTIVFLFTCCSLNIVLDQNAGTRIVKIDDLRSYHGIVRFLCETTDQNGVHKIIQVPNFKAVTKLDLDYIVGKDIYVEYGEGVFGIPYDGIYAGMVEAE